MRREFRECLNRKKLSPFPAGLKLVEKEIRAVLNDLEVVNNL